MKTGDLESELGKFQAAYAPGSGKIIMNVILSLIWFFAGWLAFAGLWGFYKERVAAVIVGLVFLISGLLFLIGSSYQRIGRKAHLYEEGVWLSQWGRAQSWRFDQIDGVRVISGQGAKVAEGLAEGLAAALPGGGLVGAFAVGALGGALKAAAPIDELVGADINGYQFFVDEQRAFDIGPDYKRWKELGAMVLLRVMNQLVPRLVDRLAQGEKLLFDPLTAGGWGKTRLTLTQEGIQEQDKPPLAWTDVAEVSSEKRPGFATIEALDQKKNITFALDSELNALVALQVLKAMVKQARANDAWPEVST
jgi:hypothetical protein